RLDQLLLIALRKVPAADRALEQDVADDGEIGLRMVEDDMARRVAGAVADVQRQLADGHLVSVDKPAGGRERPTGDAVILAVLVQPSDPEDVVLVRAFDLDVQFLRENPGAAAMVDVAVRQQDLLDRHADLARGRLQARQVSARIDERPAHRLRAPDQAAILLQRSHRNDRRAKRRFAHCAGASSTGERAAGSFFIDAETLSALRRTRRTLPPASFDRSWSDQPRRISSANKLG